MTQPARAGLLAAALAVTLAGCQDTPEPAPTPAPLPPAEERLDFHWHEEIDVPAPARAAVDVLHHWVYAYNRWATEPSIIPDYIYDHSAPEVYESIEAASAGPRPMAGTVNAFLVEMNVDDNDGPIITAGVCEDLHDYYFIDQHGEPVERRGGVISSRATLAQEPDGEWIVAERSSYHAKDLELRCQTYASGPPPSQVPGALDN